MSSQDIDSIQKRDRSTTASRASRTVWLGCIAGLAALLLCCPVAARAALSNATASTAGSSCVGVNSAAGYCGYEQSFQTNNATTIESRYA